MVDQPPVKYPVHPLEPYKQHPGDAPVDIRIWLRSFDLYTQAIDGNNPNHPMPDRLKNIHLCQNLGTEALRTFTETQAYLDRDELTHAEFQEQVRRHFGTRITPFKARFDFHHHQQEPDETIQQFETALRILIKDCEYPEDFREGMLATQLVNGTIELQAQRELMAKDTTEFQAVLKHLMAHETARKEATTIKPTAEVHVMRGQRNFRHPLHSNRGRGHGFASTTTTTTTPTQVPTNICRNCASASHRAGDPTCPAIGQQCSSCGKLNHFTRACLSNPNQGRGQQRGGRRRRRRGRTPSITVASATVAHIADKAEGIQTQFWMSDGRSFIPVKFQVDTGAEVSIMSEHLYRRMFPKLPLKKSPRTLTTVSGSPLQTMGVITTNVQFGGRVQRGIVYIVRGTTTAIMGNNFLKPLKVIINCNDGQVQTIKVDNIQAKFPQLFDMKMGTYCGQPHRIRVRPDAIPRAVRLRTIPIARREAAIEEVRAMDKAGIWEEVLQSEWVHPLVVVPKANGSVCITTDLTALNQHVIPERFPLPKIADLFLHMAGSKIFSKLDLKKGYFHIPLTDDSKDYTTTITPIGLRRYCRLPMGLTDAASAFQRCVQQTLAGLDGVEVYIDDVVIHGKDQAEHDHRLYNAFDRLQTAGFRLQPKKLLFSVDSIPAFRHIVSKDGIKPDPKNIEAICTAKTPTTHKEVQSFLGMITYFQSFIPDAASLTEPLRQLTRQDQTFHWGPEQEMSFQTLRKLLTQTTQLQVFDPQAPTMVTTDASNIGLGGILSQIQQGQEVPIAFYSCTLSTPERNYSATEKEALATIRTMEHWENYLLGRCFKLRTDHQALRQLLMHPTSQRQSAKFHRWAERLAAFDYEPMYIKGTDNKVADYLSRLQNKATELRVSLTNKQSTPIAAIRVEQHRTATESDPTFQHIKEILRSGHLHTFKQEPGLQPYRTIAHELSFAEDGCLYRGSRIVVPPALHQELLKELHIGHPGIARMKNMARRIFWWPGIDKQIDQFCRHCTPCQRSSKSMPALDLPETTIPRPTEPRQQYTIDIAGPFYNGHCLVVLIDYRSRFPELLDTTDTTSSKLIHWLEDVFDRNGNPQGLVSDNGPQFTSKAFETFLQNRDIYHYLTSRYNPQENGLVERFNRFLKGGIEAFSSSNVSWTQGLRELLASYRSTPKADSLSPAEKFFKRSCCPKWAPNTAVPRRRPVIDVPQVPPHSHEYKYVGDSLYKKGEKVLTKLPHVPKGRSPYSEPKMITQVLGRYTYKLADGSIWNARKLKPYRQTVRRYLMGPEYDNDGEHNNGELHPDDECDNDEPHPRPQRRRRRTEAE